MAKKEKFNTKDMHLLMSSERRQSIDTYSLLSRLPIKPHHIVADIGCGPGYFAIPIAKYVYGGKLYAFDVQEEMLDAVKKGMVEARLTNIQITRSKERTIPLENGHLDGALIAFVLQEATSPKALLNEIYRCLKPSGWLAILEWHKQDTDHGPPIERRIDPATMESMTRQIPFRGVVTRQLNQDQYMTLMKK